MKPTSSKKVTASDRLFEQAVEDIVRFGRDVDEWPANDNPSSSLPALTAGHGRGRLALARLAELAPSADQKYLRQLELKFHEAEVDLNSHLSSQNKNDIRFFAEDGYLWQALREADRCLRTVRELSRDGMYFDNEEWNRDELVQAASDFLVLFTELAWLARWSHPSLTSQDGYRRWQEEFTRVEERFRGWFGYFHPAGAMLTNIRDREYGAAFWWLMTTPARDMIDDDAFTDAQIKGMGRMLRHEGMTPEPCPEQMVIALALGDPLTEDDRRRVERHKETCRTCRKLYNDVQEAHAESVRSPGEVTVPQVLLDTIRGTETSRLIYDSPDAFAAALQKIAACQLQSEASDFLVKPTDDWQEHLHSFFLEPPAVSARPAEPGGYVAYLQAASIPSLGLAGQMETQGGTKAWVKIARVVDNMIDRLGIVELADLHWSISKRELSLTGALPSWLKLPETIQWFCDWLSPDGSVIQPISLETEAHHFIIRFDLGERKGQQSDSLPDGELRVLILAFGP